MRRSVAMFEHYDERARMCVVLAQEEARRLGHDEIGTVHLLLGIGRIDDGLLGVEIETVRATVVALQGSGGTPTRDAIPFTAEATATLRGANAQALALGHTTIGIAHLLLALMEAGGGGARALREAGAIPSEVRERALAVAGGRSSPAREPVGATIADIGRAQLDAHLLELILAAGGPVAHLLRAQGVDEDLLGERFGPPDQRG